MSSAIIDAADGHAHANSTPFYFLFGLSVASFVWLLFFVDVGKSRVEQREFLERERVAKAKLAGGGSEVSER